MGLITLVSRALGSMYSWDVLLQLSQQTILLALVVIENQSLLEKNILFLIESCWNQTYNSNVIQATLKT